MVTPLDIGAGVEPPSLRVSRAVTSVAVPSMFDKKVLHLATNAKKIVYEVDTKS
jgi:hypothetical protein